MENNSMHHIGNQFWITLSWHILQRLFCTVPLPWSKLGLFFHFSSLSSSVCPVQETISRQCLHLCCTSKAKQGRSAAPILAALHHILKLFLEPKKHITHFILLLVKEELVANSKKSHLWNMPASGLILPEALSSQFPPTLCFLQESGLCRIGLS